MSRNQSRIIRVVARIFPRTYTAIWNDGYDHGVTDAESGTTSY